MNLNTLFTQAFNLPPSWSVVDFHLDYKETNITFNLSYDAKTAPCPHCGQSALIHDRKDRQWRHIDFFHFKAYFSAKIPRTKCTSCLKTVQLEVPWARKGSGFTLGFEAICISLAQILPLLHVAKILGISDKQVFRQVDHYVDKARELQTYQEVKTIGIDETSTKKGHNYITLVHDLERKQLLFATEGKGSETINSFLSDFKQRNGEPEKIQHACIDMSPAYIKGVTESLPNAQISFDTFHVVALVGAAMEAVRKSELSPKARKQSPVPIDSGKIKSLMWGMRKDQAMWNEETTQAMEALKKSKLKSAKAWLMKETFRTICNDARKTNDRTAIEKNLKSWISWATRCRLEPFKEVAKTLKKHFDGIVRGLMDNRSNAYVEAMNGLLQQAKRAAKGYRNVNTFITIAYLRMGKLDHLPQNPMYQPQRST